MSDTLLLYGSYGYAGSLIAREATARGLSVRLGGRRPGPVERQATDLGLDFSVFSLERADAIERQLADVSAVLNCAGPFSATAEPLYSACLATGTDYLDITGEYEVIEAMARRDPEARAAGVALVPAVGYDVVPADCLAAFLHSRLPSATHLTLAVDAVREEGEGNVSVGSMKTYVESLGAPGAVRRDGEIRTVPPAWKTREIAFGSGTRPAMTTPWGDVSTAYYTTGVPNVEVYAAAPERLIRVVRGTRALAPVLQSEPVQRGLKRLVSATASGPTPGERARNVTRIRGDVRDDEGRTVVAEMRTPDPYDVTAEASVEAARRVLDGAVEPGFRTPGSAFGADFALELDGVERELVEESAP